MVKRHADRGRKYATKWCFWPHVMALDNTKREDEKKYETATQHNTEHSNKTNRDIACKTKNMMIRMYTGVVTIHTELNANTYCQFVHRWFTPCFSRSHSLSCSYSSFFLSIISALYHLDRIQISVEKNTWFNLKKHSHAWTKTERGSGVDGVNCNCLES